jgi:hypothetical protein
MITNSFLELILDTVDKENQIILRNRFDAKVGQLVDTAQLYQSDSRTLKSLIFLALPSPSNYRN